MCLSASSETECVAPCVYDNGADLIPENAFCAPRNMTRDIYVINQCMSADKTTCVGDCKWRKGKEVANNTALISGADIFESNFCHPPTTDDWN